MMACRGCCIRILETYDPPTLSRSSLLSSYGLTGRSVDGGCVSSSLDLAVKPGSEGRRRPRRYLPEGEGVGRQTSERFRTQPVTAGEMQDSRGYRATLGKECCVM